MLVVEVAVSLARHNDTRSIRQKLPCDNGFQRFSLFGAVDSFFFCTYSLYPWLPHDHSNNFR